MRAFCHLLTRYCFFQAAPCAAAGRAATVRAEARTAGKDVVWVPSPPDMVNKLMEIGQVTPKDFVIDLGSATAAM
jgi:hypothetical protein